MKKKVGLFFGSYNPIHVGHVIIANHMLNYTDLEEVWFVVSPQSPFKTNSPLLEDKGRLHMVKLAAQANPKFFASDIEFHLPRPSYTINTLEHFTKNEPDIEPVIIMGEDNLCHIDDWLDAKKILATYSIYSYPRSTWEDDPESRKVLNELYESPNIQLIEAPLLDISSTYVRDLIHTGKDASYVLPKPVLEYIQKHGLYIDVNPAHN